MTRLHITLTERQARAVVAALAKGPRSQAALSAGVRVREALRRVKA